MTKTKQELKDEAKANYERGLALVESLAIKPLKVAYEKALAEIEAREE